MTMDYSQLSDFEINRRVCEALDMEEHFFIPDDEADFDSELPTDERGPIWQTQKRDINGFRSSNGNCFNPCNNPEYAWPIITENKISIMFDSTDTRYWICPYISRHLLSLNPLQARCRRYSRGER
ncbi:phage protein NinX family protein [Escherichia coli]